MNIVQEARDIYTNWVETYTPLNFISYDAPGGFSGVKNQYDDNLIWTLYKNNGTDLYVGGIYDQNPDAEDSVVVGWRVCLTPWKSSTSEFPKVPAEVNGPCQSCNVRGDQDTFNPECQDCGGDGFVHEYFDTNIAFEY